MMTADRSFYEENGELFAAQGDELDLARSIEESEIHANLSERRQRQLAAIDDAFDRLRQGSYGFCKECGEQIPPERLKLLPLCSRCVDCQQEYEISNRLSTAQRECELSPVLEGEDDKSASEWEPFSDQEYAVQGRRFGPRGRQPEILGATATRQRGRKKRV